MNVIKESPNAILINEIRIMKYILLQYLFSKLALNLYSKTLFSIIFKMKNFV